MDRLEELKERRAELKRKVAWAEDTGDEEFLVLKMELKDVESEIRYLENEKAESAQNTLPLFGEGEL